MPLIVAAVAVPFLLATLLLPADVLARDRTLSFSTHGSPVLPATWQEAREAARVGGNRSGADGVDAMVHERRTEGAGTSARANPSLAGLFVGRRPPVLTSRQAGGSSGRDSLEGDVGPTAEPGVLIGEVVGNTVSRGARATFTIELATRPRANVYIDLETSDRDQGRIVAETVAFSPYDWHFPQKIAITGAHPFPAPAGEHYDIITSTARSTDPQYADLPVDDIAMRGLQLEVVTRTKSIRIISGLYREVRINYRSNVTSHKDVAFTSDNLPPGMSLSAEYSRLG